MDKTPSPEAALAVPDAPRPRVQEGAVMGEQTFIPLPSDPNEPVDLESRTAIEKSIRAVVASALPLAILAGFLGRALPEETK